MSSDDLPQNSNSAASPDPGRAGSTDGQQGGQAYPPAHYNTGEYRRPLAQPAVPPASDARTTDPATTDDLGSADTGPLRVPAADPGSSSPPAGEPTGPDGPDMWRPRPSGALAAEAWSAPASSSPLPTAGYPTGIGGYPPGPYGSGYGTGQFGQPYGAQPNAGGYGSAQSEAPYGSYPGAGYAGYPQQSSAPSAGGSAVATKPRGTRNRLLVGGTAVVLMLGASFGAGAVGASVARPATTDSSLTQQTSSPVVSNTLPVASGSVESVAAKLLPSVVSILSISSSEEAEGSGIILSADGLILTNNHVIAGATTLTVKFNDGNTASAKVIGSDATDDLAVIKVSGVSGLKVATLGSSANVKVGEQVVAVGSPLGLSATVTSGIVSALNRPVRTASEDTQGDPSQSQGQGSTTAQDTVLNAIQTDAAINPGNSGGALVDMSGAVIGINSAIASLSSGSSSAQSGSIGVGFAIPIDQAHRIAQEIISTGQATHAVLGASVGDAPDPSVPDPSQAAQAGLSVGAKIASVTSGGGAAGAGLAAGDVITKVGSTPVASADALIATIRSATPGSKVTVTYQRSSETRTATVTLGSAVSK